MSRIPPDSPLLGRALDPPRLIVEPAPGSVDLGYGMTIGIERTTKGRLWACWVGGGDGPPGFFILACSDDDGASWSGPHLVIDPHDPSLGVARRTLVGSLWRDPLNRLWLFFDQSLGYFDGRAGTWAIRCDDADAAHPVWSAPRRLWHGCNLNKPIVASDGAWLLPVSLWDRRHQWGGFEECFHELDHLRGAHVLASLDHGATWSDRGHVVLPQAQFDEHQLIERRDGSLWLTGRTAIGIHEAVSRDGGRSWSLPTPSPISQTIEPADWCAVGGNSSRHHLSRLHSGRLLLIKHGAAIGTAPAVRSHLCAFLSDDDGATWRGGLMLDERAVVSYPDATQAADGTIYASWDRNRASDGEILFGRFSEADVLAGELVTEGSRLRISIRTNPV
jgi:sialidase-1